MNSHVMRKVSSLALGSSMLILSMLPAASAFAQSAPTVTLTESGYNNIAAQVTPGASVTFHASSNISNPMYQFWAEEPSGQWVDVQNYSSNSTYTLSNVAAGNYLVDVYVMSAAEVKAGDWSAAAQPYGADGVFVDSSVTLSSPSANAIAGKPMTVTATSSNIYNPLYQFWYKNPSGEWKQSGAYGSGNFTFTPSESGTYTFIAYAKSPQALNNPEGALYSKTVSGTVVPQVAVTISPLTDLVANGVSTTTANLSEESAMATVTDTAGNPVMSATVTFTSNNDAVAGFLVSGALASTTTATTNASGQAVVSLVAGQATGTTSLTATADYQTSAAQTVTVNSSTPTAVSATSVSPTATGYPASGVYDGNLTPSSVFVGTAGTATTLSTIVTNVAGNPVPGAEVVLQGNHINNNTTVAAKNSVQLPSATTFTSFNTNAFGEATTNTSGVATFVVENSANAVLGQMSAPSGDSITVDGNSLPFNTYTMDVVPASLASSVVEGQPLPSGLAASSTVTGTAYIAWAPTTASGTAIGISGTSNIDGASSMPTTYSSNVASAAVTTGANSPEYFSVAPYITNTSSNSMVTLSSPVSTGSGITYTLTASGPGDITSIDGVNLAGINGDGWTDVNGSWNAYTPGGTNYSAATEQVTISYVGITSAGVATVVPQITVSNVNSSTPLELTGANSVAPSVAQTNVSGYASQAYNTQLTFGVNQQALGTTTVNVTASSTTTTPAVSSPTVATATDTVSTQLLGTGDTATFSPATLYTSALNSSPATETMTVDDVYGNPVVGAQVALDGFAPSSTVAHNSATVSGTINAVWVTAVNSGTLVGTTASGASVPDAFPLIGSAQASSLTSANYTAPNAIGGVAYANGAALDVTTNNAGQVTLTLATQAEYIHNSGSSVAYSAPVSGTQYWASAWNAATKTNIGYASIVPISTTPSAVNGTVVTPGSASGLAASTPETATFEAVTASGQPAAYSPINLADAGLNQNVWVTAVNGNNIVETGSTPNPEPMPLFNTVPLSPALGYSQVTPLYYANGQAEYTGTMLNTSTPMVNVYTNASGTVSVTFQVAGVSYLSSTGVVVEPNTSATAAPGSLAGSMTYVSPSAAANGFTGFTWVY